MSGSYRRESGICSGIIIPLPLNDLTCRVVVDCFG